MIIDSSAMWKSRAAYEKMQAVYDDYLTQITVPYEALRLDRTSIAYAEWAVDVMDALHIERAFHAGLSGGGWLIIKLATAAPEKIAAAILMSTGGFVNVSRMFIARLLPHFMIAPFISTRQFAIRFLKITTPPDYEITEGDIMMFELIGNFKAENGVPAFSDAELQQLTAPTLLLMGEHEVPFAPIEKVISRAKQHLPNLVSAEILPGVGHGMNGENPAMIHDKIASFLAQYKGSLRE